VAAGCILAAAGAGAGGAIYFTDRGAESVVAAPGGPVVEATRATFRELGIRETKTSEERDGATEKRSVEGSATDRDVSVSLATERGSTRVHVVVRKSAVTWDKDFARAVLEKIVARSQ
jgi:hypothetical protein